MINESLNELIPDPSKEQLRTMVGSLLVQCEAMAYALNRIKEIIPQAIQQLYSGESTRVIKETLEEATQIIRESSYRKHKP